MQAMIINQYGGPEQLVLREIPTPVPDNGEVLIKVRAFGINRAEVYMRKGLFGETTSVSGIECVGQVEDDSTGTLPRGQTVTTITGGMVEPHYRVKREGVVEKASIHGHTVAYANM